MEEVTIYAVGFWAEETGNPSDPSSMTEAIGPPEHPRYIADAVAQGEVVASIIDKPAVYQYLSNGHLLKIVEKKYA